jgi:hypothetical protein
LTSRIEDLENRFVLGGTLLAEVGDCSTLVAGLPVSERLLDDLSIGTEVRGFVRQRPLSPIHGRIVKISPATAEQPKTVTGKAEPSAPTAQPDRFVALAEFDNKDGMLKPGAVLQAKIYSRRASYAARVWRVLRRRFQSVAW